MGRSGYSECDGFDDEAQQWAWIRAQGARRSALRGKRGQAFLRRLAAALDAMPVKSLCRIPSSDDGHRDDKNGTWVAPSDADRLGLSDGQVCVLGSLALAEGRDPKAIDATDHDALGKMFDIAPIIVRDLEWDNDQRYGSNDEHTEGEQRWKYLREWVADRIQEAPAAAGGA